ncbi:ATP-NAD kinase family protein [Oceanisphaera psychrotolerans]|uniref:ATP-NAD kinase n=1 Tax=Oceanisphaera psychrotolerans TaxID=1414654 RepID=A0A1J4QCL8_9GAMM|nr:ATP-NAD kinase family protein [Oceanisphaera psychrotolerans]OIN07946.1 ATP-NAD kinase [Oceanisphaera psychrotolerans]
MFKIGLIINPLAGLGGSVALKGSDGMAEQALVLGAEPRALTRTQLALAELTDLKDRFTLFTVAGDMGETVCRQLALPFNACYRPASPTTAEDTRNAVASLVEQGIDLLLFAGGDGTARDVCAAAPDGLCVLGIPAGVKIHSGVYGVTPAGTGRLLAKLVRGEPVSLMEADVMDIDEAAFREGRVRARRYGEMLIPGELSYVQAVKVSGVESDELVLTDIADDIIERMQEDDDCYFIMGSGSTVAAVMERLGLENTLLGVDLVYQQRLVASDLDARGLYQQIRDKKSKLVITLIGGQGHIFGRGNQQLSPEVIKTVGRDNIWLLATKTKLNSLQGRPLRVDTNDPELDRALGGLMRVITGYHDEVLVRVANPEDEAQ